jgi:23S rRNA pseudouridine2605 synthase
VASRVRRAETSLHGAIAETVASAPHLAIGEPQALTHRGRAATGHAAIDHAQRPAAAAIGPRSDRPGSREGGTFAPRKPFASRPKDGAKFGAKTGFSKAGKFAGKPEGPREDTDQFSSAEVGKRVYRKFDAPRERRDQSPRGDRPARPFSPDQVGRPFSGKPTSTFAKFAGNKKPFGKRPPGRKFKPEKGESA